MSNIAAFHSCKKWRQDLIAKAQNLCKPLTSKSATRRMKPFPIPQSTVSLLSSAAYNFQLQKKAFDPVFAGTFLLLPVPKLKQRNETNAWKRQQRFGRISSRESPYSRLTATLWRKSVCCFSFQRLRPNGSDSNAATARATSALNKEDIVSNETKLNSKFCDF
jgi:hypothetical protein